MADERVPVLIVGGGLAGLRCAQVLRDAGRPFLLLEAADAVGGRVRTDAMDGFLLDRGFQVLLDAYPEARTALRYDELALQPFFPGCLIRTADGMQVLADPWREPLRALGTLFASSPTWGDRLRIARLRKEAAATMAPPADRSVPDVPTRDYLEQRGFSADFIHRFFRPFFRGIFLEPNLATSARMFHFVFGMMARGNTVLPQGGMEAIPRQMAAGLDANSIRCGVTCERVEEKKIVCADGSGIAFDRLVLATDAFTTSRLLGLPVPDPPRKTTCLYFAAEKSPVDLPAIVLNGTGRGVVNHIATLSDVAHSYAPEGSALISATLVGEAAGEDRDVVRQVRRELSEWFGGQVDAWRHLRTYRISFAQPNQDAGIFSRPRMPSGLPPWVTICGDAFTDASIDGALRSGRRAAELVLS